MQPPNDDSPPQNQDAAPAGVQPYWRVKPLEAMSPAEWEALCDGCGRCCLVKLEDEDTGAIHATSIGCTLFDAQSCRCRDYDNRAARVPDCVTLTPALVRQLSWLPPTCAYRLIAEGRDLYWWHPLVSGDDHTVEAAGVSVKGRVSAMEHDVPPEQLQEHLATWPLRFPKKARAL
jgi:uncharacterized cysteine cluster protein YcgN (CxxCxxCC family)